MPDNRDLERVFIEKLYRIVHEDKVKWEKTADQEFETVVSGKRIQVECRDEDGDVDYVLWLFDHTDEIAEAFFSTIVAGDFVFLGQNMSLGQAIEDVYMTLKGRHESMILQSFIEDFDKLL